MSWLFAISLYYVSFAPLWVSILFIDIKSIIEDQVYIWTEILSISCILVFALVSLIILLMELCTQGKEGTSHYKVESAREEKTITAEYLLSYILPLFAFDFTLWQGVVLFLIFFVTLGFLCVRHNYFSVNIVLELLNFRFYNCSLKNEDGIKIDKIIISHRKLNGCVGDVIYLKLLNNEYNLDIKQ